MSSRGTVKKALHTYAIVGLDLLEDEVCALKCEAPYTVRGAQIQ